MAGSPSAGWTIHRYLDGLSSAEPAPGGGSAAALVAALGCSLGSMVCRLLLRRPTAAAAQRRQWRQGLRRFERSRRRLEFLMVEDARLYREWVRARRRGRGAAQARRKATRCLLAICEEASVALAGLGRLGRSAGATLGADVRAGRSLLKGALEGAAGTARVNLRGIRMSKRERQELKCLSRLQGRAGV